MKRIVLLFNYLFITSYSTFAQEINKKIEFCNLSLSLIDTTEILIQDAFQLQFSGELVEGIGKLINMYPNQFQIKGKIPAKPCYVTYKAKCNHNESVRELIIQSLKEKCHFHLKDDKDSIDIFVIEKIAPSKRIIEITGEEMVSRYGSGINAGNSNGLCEVKGASMFFFASYLSSVFKIYVNAVEEDKYYDFSVPEHLFSKVENLIPFLQNELGIKMHKKKAWSDIKIIEFY